MKEDVRLFAMDWNIGSAAGFDRVWRSCDILIFLILLTTLRSICLDRLLFISLIGETVVRKLTVSFSRLALGTESYQTFLVLCYFMAERGEY